MIVNFDVFSPIMEHWIGSNWRAAWLSQ